MFRKEADFEAFERVMVEAHERQPIRILSYCVLSNHWHFVAWPEEDGQLTDFFRRLAHTHAMRWRVSHRTVGYGHLYQGKLCRIWAWSTPFVRRVGHASQASLGRTRKANYARASEMSSPKQTNFVSVSFTWRQTNRSPNDQPCPVVRPQDDPVTPRPRPGPGGAGGPDLAEEGRQEDFHLVERERHPQADSVAAAEGEPLVRAKLPLQEPLGAEPIGLGVEVRAGGPGTSTGRGPTRPGTPAPAANGRTVFRTTNGTTGLRRRLSRIATSRYSSAGRCSASGGSPPVTRRPRHGDPGG